MVGAYPIRRQHGRNIQGRCDAALAMGRRRGPGLDFPRLDAPYFLLLAGRRPARYVPGSVGHGNLPRRDGTWPVTASDRGEACLLRSIPIQDVKIA